MKKQKQKSAPRPPIVKACALWYWILLVVLVFFVGNLIFLTTQLEILDDSSSATSHGNPFEILWRRSNTGTTKSFARIHNGSNVEEEMALPRLSHVSDSEYTTRIQQLEKQIGGISCRHNSQTGQRATYIINGDFCESNNPTTYYNPLARERFICGTAIPAKSQITLDTKCMRPARLFPVTPDQTGTGMPPVKLSFGGSRQGQLFPCNVPCLNSGSPGIVTTRTVETIDGGPDWKLAFSMEGQDYYSQLKINPTAYLQNQFYSTTSYKSEVPLPYFSWSEYKIQAPPVDYDKVIHGAAFLARNCNSQNNREKIVQALINSSFRVDSLSSCLHNAEPPPGVNLSDKNAVMKQYLFYLAFENQCTEDYITEKLWGPLESGTVPVYYGSSNVREHVPNNSVVVVEDFASPVELADYLQKVANDKALYAKHQAWRSQPLPEHFHRRYDFTEIHSTCRTCRWAYARFYGLGWNHANQSLRELETPRKPSLEQGLVQKPIVEKWMAQTTSKGDAQIAVSMRDTTTRMQSSEHLFDKATLEVDGGSVRRTLWEQDGAIDFWIERGEKTTFTPLVLRLETPFPGTDESIKVRVVSDGHARLQSSRTRFSILTLPRLNAKLKMNEAGGIVEIPVEAASLPLRIRILVEDIDTIHQGADEEENFFAKLMIQDFYHPVESFVLK